jgi:hypothetical protein
VAPWIWSCQYQTRPILIGGKILELQIFSIISTAGQTNQQFPMIPEISGLSFSSSGSAGTHQRITPQMLHHRRQCGKIKEKP